MFRQVVTLWLNFFRSLPPEMSAYYRIVGRGTAVRSTHRRHDEISNEARHLFLYSGLRFAGVGGRRQLGTSCAYSRI
jgi:hypothetical protein